MTQTLISRGSIDLNTASEREIAELSMVGCSRAERLCESRPFRSWEDIKRIPGFGAGLVRHLQSQGVQIGKWTAEPATPAEFMASSAWTEPER